MSWSYTYGANPMIDYPRMLIADTDPTRQLFQDSEITSAYGIQAAMFQSSMFYSGPTGQFSLPSQPVSYFRLAAILLECLASNASFLSSVKSIPDVTLDPQAAAKALRDQAQWYRDVEDNSGAFIILEQCTTEWSTRDRFWAQIQRQSGG